MNRLDLFVTTLEKTKEILAGSPYVFPLESVVKQLEYLISLEEGRNTDRSDLDAINIGQIAARDIDEFEPGLADLLHDVSSEARKMRSES